MWYIYVLYKIVFASNNNDVFKSTCLNSCDTNTYMYSYTHNYAFACNDNKGIYGSSIMCQALNKAPET